MATPDKFSETNVVNSVALYLASKLIANGYLLYYHKRDVLQIADSPAGWYYQFSVNKAAILADPTVAAAVASAKGLVTVTDGLPAVPRFIQRLISDASIGPADVVSVPAVSVELSPVMLTESYELGARTKWRYRHLLVDSYVRTPDEQALFKDWLALWFEQDTFIAVHDHDAGTLAEIGTVRLEQVRVDHDRLVTGPEATTYQVLANALTEYVA